MLNAVLDALLECLAFLELSDEGSVDPDDAIRTMESVAHILAGMPESDRRTLADMVRARAAVEPDAARRAFYEATPEGLGLINAED
jgi:DNA-binding FadR family transcriptional regulator